MSVDPTSVILTTARIALNPKGYLLEQIIEATSKRVTKADSVADSDTAALKDEVERQQLQMQMAEA